MIARTETDKVDSWGALAAPLPADAIQWRQDGRPVSRDGKHLARFVAYVDAHFVHDRFDSVVPGEWDSTLELLPPAVTTDGEEVEPFGFKCRIQVLGVIREDVGTGKDYKSAASDAFKRAAVRFGIAKELYSYGPNWVPMDGDGRYAKPLEDPGIVYARKHSPLVGKRIGNHQELRAARLERVVEQVESERAKPLVDGQVGYGAVPERGEQASGADEIPSTASPSDEQQCPKCGGRMWDNRLTKRNPKAPDWKCRDRACDGVVWPPKPSRQRAEEAEDEGAPF